MFVAPGELVCLLGPSGCGKTTLLRIAAGLEDLQTGVVEIDGTVVADGAQKRSLPPEQRGVGLMFQDYALFPHLNVRDNVTFGLGKASGSRSEWLDGALTSMGVENYANAYPHTLSGGQQQRVALLRALAPQPRVLLLDEPCSALDPIATGKIEDLIDELRGHYSILIVTHNMQQAARVSDNTALMYLGRLVEYGTTQKIFMAPRLKETEDYVTGRFG